MISLINVNLISSKVKYLKVLKNKKLNLSTKCALSTSILYNFQNKVMVIPSHKCCRVFVRYTHKQNVYAIGTNLIRGTVPRVNPTRALRPTEPQLHSRGMASVHGGVFKNSKQVSKTTASNNETYPVESDVSGKHKIAVVISCSSAQCKNYTCSNTVSENNPCKIPPKVHQESVEYILQENPQLTAELAGAITHKIPLKSSGVKLHEIDYKGNKTAAPQFLVQEKGVTPINSADFKEKERITKYLQNAEISVIAVNALPAASVLNTKNPNKAIIGKKIDTPLDDKL